MSNLKNKRILFAASMNGGAAVLSPVIKRLQQLPEEQRPSIRVFSQFAAPKTFDAMGVTHEEISEKSFAYHRIREFNPDIIVTGTQVQSMKLPDPLDQNAWNSGRILKVPTLAVLDTRANVLARFSDLDKTKDVDVPPVLRRLTILPSMIAVFDEIQRNSMVAQGFDPNMLRVTGSSDLEASLEAARWLGGDATRQRLLERPVFEEFYKDLNTQFVVLLSDSFHKTEWGFDERDVMEGVLKTLDLISANLSLKINVLVRPHPHRGKDASAIFGSIPTSERLSKIIHHPATKSEIDRRNANPENRYSLEELLYSADIVIGTCNNPLVNAAITRTARGDDYPLVVNYMPDLNPAKGGDESQQFLADLGASTRVTREEELIGVLRRALAGELIQKPYQAAVEATQRVIGLIESLMH